MGDRDIAGRLTLELGMVDTIGGLGPRKKPLERVKSLKKRDGRGTEKLITWTCIVYTYRRYTRKCQKRFSYAPKDPLKILLSQKKRGMAVVFKELSLIMPNDIRVFFLKTYASRNIN